MSTPDISEGLTFPLYPVAVLGGAAMDNDVTLTEVDEALTLLCKMLTRAVNAPDLPNVKHFLERIDQLLEERWALGFEERRALRCEHARATAH